MNPQHSAEQPESPSSPKRKIRGLTRFALGGLGCLVLLVLVFVGMIGSYFMSPERAARSRLDTLLGQGNAAREQADLGLPESALPPEDNLQMPSPQQEPDSPLEQDLKRDLQDMLSQVPGAVLRGENMPGENIKEAMRHAVPGGVDVKETPEALLIEVPVKDHQAARKIEVKASPNWVQITGQVELGDPNAGAKMTTSFMRSFNSVDPLVPEKMTRKVIQSALKGRLTLVVTIPKQRKAGESAKTDLRHGPEANSPANPQPEKAPSKRLPLQGPVEFNTDQPLDGYI